LAALVADPAQADTPAIAVCEHRACLLLVDPSYDSDGDSFTDVDEYRSL